MQFRVLSLTCDTTHVFPHHTCVLMQLFSQTCDASYMFPCHTRVLTKFCVLTHMFLCHTCALMQPCLLTHATLHTSSHVTCVLIQFHAVPHTCDTAHTCSDALPRSLTRVPTPIPMFGSSSVFSYTCDATYMFPTTCVFQCSCVLSHTSM